MREFEPSEWLSPSSYWLPSHFMESAWVEHAPFGFWIMEAIEPRSVVELGTHLGYSLFVFAEAAKRAGRETSILGVDSWEGDEHAGFYDQDIYDYVKTISDRDYPGLVELRRGFFSDVVSTVDDASIDLLHIDGRHGYDDIVEDFTLFRPKLSARSVVLFHDTNEFQEGFGVHRFWNEVKESHPSFGFEHGHGLGVLATGPDIPPQLRRFLEVAGSDPVDVQRVYHALGGRVAAVADTHRALRDSTSALQSSSREIDRLNDVVEGATGEKSRLADQVAALERAVGEIKSSTSWRMTKPVRGIGSVVSTLRRS